MKSSNNIISRSEVIEHTENVADNGQKVDIHSVLENQNLVNNLREADTNEVLCQEENMADYAFNDASRKQRGQSANIHASRKAIDEQ